MRRRVHGGERRGAEWHDAAVRRERCATFGSAASRAEASGGVARRRGTGPTKLAAVVKFGGQEGAGLETRS